MPPEKGPLTKAVRVRADLLAPYEAEARRRGVPVGDVVGERLREGPVEARATRVQLAKVGRRGKTLTANEIAAQARVTRK